MAGAGAAERVAEKKTRVKLIKTEREYAGLSQLELARSSGLSSAMISCLGCGRSGGSEKVLASVARALGLNAAWLRSGLGKRESDWPDG